MLRTKIKASSISNLTDARYFAAWDVTWMGFCLDPADEAYLPPQAMQAIRGWIDGPRIVGEFNMQSADEIREAIDVLKLDAIQAGPFTSAETLLALQSPVPVIKEWIIERESRPEALRESIEAMSHLAALHLLNFQKNGLTWPLLLDEKNTFPPGALSDFCSEHRVLLAIDMEPSMLPGFLDQVKPEGLSLSGGAEERTGFKSYDEIDLLLEALEVPAGS